MSTPLVQTVFERSTGFGYSTRVFSVVRDAGTVVKSATRKQIETQEVIHPSHLAPLGALKQEAFRLCRAYGTKFEIFNLWIVPKDDEDALNNGLLDINSRWEAFVHNELLPNYIRWVEKYATENPTCAADILRLAPTLEQVKQSTKFQLARLDLAKADVHAINLEEEVEGLWGQVLKEIASEIKDAKMDKSKSYTQAARSVIARIMRKCDGLDFLHPRLAEVSKTLQELSASMPASGSIKGIEALAVKQVLDVLLNPAKFMRDGFGTGNYQTALELEPSTPPSAEQPEVFSIAGPTAEPAAAQAIAADQPDGEPVVDADVSLDAIFGPGAIPPADQDLDTDVQQDAAAPAAAPPPPAPAVKSTTPEHEPALAGISTEFDGW